MHVNNTLHGITFSGGISEFTSVVSNFSLDHGLTFTIIENKVANNISLMNYMELRNIVTANNSKSGIFISLNENLKRKFDLIISSCLLYGNNEHGLHIVGNATITVKKCDVIDNNLSGIFISQSTGGLTELLQSTLSQNREHALSADIGEGILIESCDISNHHYYSRWTIQSIRIRKNFVGVKSTVRIRKNTFINNIGDGIDISSNYIQHAFDCKIEENLFQNGNRSLQIATQDFQGHVIISRNVFRNVLQAGSEVIKLYLREYSTLEFTQNNITGCMSSSIMSLNMQSNVNITMQGNIMKNNFVLTTIVLTTIDILGYYTSVFVTRNVFSNPGCECEINVPVFKQSLVSIHALYNFWGHDDVYNVSKKVCGFEKDMKKAFIYYIPYFLDEKLHNLIKLDQESFDIDNNFGGEVTGQLSLTQHHSPYTVSRSIIIRQVYC